MLRALYVPKNDNRAVIVLLRNRSHHQTLKKLQMFIDWMNMKKEINIPAATTIGAEKKTPTTAKIKRVRRKRGRPRRHQPGQVIGFYTKLETDAYLLLKKRARERNISMLQLLHELIYENLDGHFIRKNREERFVDEVLRMVSPVEKYWVNVSTNRLLKTLSEVGCTQNMTTLTRYMKTMIRKGLAKQVAKNVYAIRNKYLVDDTQRILQGKPPIHYPPLH